MRKIYQLFFAAVLMALSAVTANAGEMISLEEVPFCSWDGWGADAQSTGTATCAWVIDEPSGQPYGDPSVINYADLTNYSKLVVTVTEGTPRFLFNRDVDEGQWNADESQSHLIDNTQNGWSAKYFTSEATDDGTTVFTVDLKQITKDKGFCHLHAIKGANWTNVTVISMEVEKVGKGQQIGWINLINNSDMEGDDVSSFFTKVAKGEPQPSEITDGVGVNDSRGIVVEATAKESDAWDNQFWFRFNEIVPADAKYRVSFDYRADTPATVSTQAHAEPSDYIHYEMLGNIDFTTEWQTYTKEGTVTASQAGPNQGGGLFTSIAFNLNELADANNYYFDNIKFEVYKAGIAAEFYMDVVQIDFGFDTNIAKLVAASGKPRLVFPKDLVKVTVGGEELSVMSVEAYADGRFFIFLEDDASTGGEVRVKLKNPSDAAHHIVYEGGPGGDVPDFDDVAEENPNIYTDDVYPYAFATPTLVSADPEDGSFNLPNSIKEFKLVFDKPTDCAALVATMGKEKLTVSPAEGYAEEITLTRTGTSNLTTGSYTIKVDKIYPEERLDESIFGTLTYIINVGKVDTDPNDVPKDLIPAEYFADCAANGIPEGFYVTFGEEERTADGGTYGSGPRMFNFADGGDFTKGLYFREGYVQYGSMDGYALTLESGKKYNIHFNTAMWKDNGTRCRFQIMNEYEEAVLTEMVSNTPNVNGGTGVVNGATSIDIAFTPDVTGNYLLRWTAATSEDGDPGFIEVLLANVSCKYIPNIAGVEEVQLLETALANAKTTLEGNEDERYAGKAYNELDAAIKKYEAEGPDYTAPSKYKAAAAALDAAAQAMKEHHLNCNSYDEQMKKVIDAVRQNGEGKFASTELYGQLVTINNKYHGSSEWVAYDPEDPDMGGEFAYTFDKLTDDAALQAAVDELSGVAQAAVYMFTEGESKTSSDVGIKVLVDRIRQGAEGLMQLGVAEDDELIVAANNAVSDDDELVEALKNRLKLEYFNKMKNGEDMFPTIVDEETLEETSTTYNFTVFVKNPNTYCWKGSEGVTEENCPGWTVVDGNKPGLTDMWNGSYVGDIDGLPKDLCITTYHQTNRIEQTITDLPAGVYTVMIDCAEWSDEFTVSEDDDEETAAQKEANHEQNRVYAKTSDTPEYFEGEEEQFAADARIDHYGQYVGRHENFLTDVEVTDGVLTIGVKWNNLAQMMFDRVQVLLANPVAGFDYGKAYEEVLTGVDAQQQVAKVRAIELFDLNGQRIPVAKKGVVIVKKHMSDGTIRTQKIVK